MLLIVTPVIKESPRAGLGIDTIFHLPIAGNTHEFLTFQPGDICIKLDGGLLLTNQGVAFVPPFSTVLNRRFKCID